MFSKNKIVVTGGTGRFAQALRKAKTKHKLIYPKKSQLNIIDLNSIRKYLAKTKPASVLHLAGLSRPMIEHEKNIGKSIKFAVINTNSMIITSKTT